SVISQGSSHLWHGIHDLRDLQYDISVARTTLTDLVAAMDTVAPDRHLLGLETTSAWKTTSQLAKLWLDGAESWRDPLWLVSSSNEVFERLRSLLDDAR